MKKINITLFFSLIAICLFSQIPYGYYDNAEGKSGQELKQALFNIINSNVTTLSYNQLWNAYPLTDKKPNGKVWDIYSDIPGGIPPYEYTFIIDQCGNYNSEGDCYNREHTVPASWFNDASPMYTDLFHVLPTDGYVNNRRSNYPYGNVGSASWTSLNGSKVGSSITTGYSGIVFEPIDSFKGDIARIYFYMSTRYMNKINNWNGESFENGDLAPWAKNLFLQWHQLDPVSTKEKQRNDSVFVIQHNRNPFIDHPEWVASIWGPSAHILDYNFVANIYTTDDFIHIYFPNVNDDVQIKLYTIQGQLIYNDIAYNPTDINIPISFNRGLYVIIINNKTNFFIQKLIIQ
ncbi:MAG: endonuclease [Bacteroidales bacterium]|jgi:endonuclease I|nr:endonuclease [Bacteroidales bacterium]MDI9576019.1 endonuclease [Bacteroidota bacterium]MDD3756118.1 endonuclease [Bacteroidales bacterium]MDY0401358.1 endonuclease [Bacteroidales bacterium]HHW59384.1 T9SS type A sorting domain-containing protein [Bacteroidales bacterium]